AGLVVGQRELVQRLEKHPLHRALRIDKLSLAALEATLRMYRDGRAAQVPAVRMLHEDAATLAPRAARLVSLLAERGVRAQRLPVTSMVGGGALPLASPPSIGVVIDRDARGLHERLRRSDPAVVARIEDD